MSIQTFNLLEYIAKQKELTPKIPFSGLATTATDQTTLETGAILAPGVDLRLVISLVIVQSTGSEAVTVLLKDGVGDTTPLRIRCGGDSVGIGQPLNGGTEIVLSPNTPFIPNLSTATPVIISGHYYVIDLNGVPV